MIYIIISIIGIILGLLFFKRFIINERESKISLEKVTYTKIKLSEEMVAFLVTQPEEGQGYHVVDVTLRNGNKLKNRLVYNCEYLVIVSKEVITTNDIDSIKISK